MKIRTEFNEQQIPIAAEDKFLVFAFGKGDKLAPHSHDCESLGDILVSNRNPFPGLTPLFDIRGLEGYYNDIDMFIKAVGGKGSYVLLGKAEINSGWEEILKRHGLLPVKANGEAFSTHVMDVEYFKDEIDELVESLIPECETFEEAESLAREYQEDDFFEFLKSIHRHSFMVELAMSLSGEEILVTPYHSHALHEVETINNAILVGRPAVIASTTRAILSTELLEFQHLINDPNTRESHIQKFLEKNSSFLRGLNYQNIYPQIVLQRDDGSSLRPDFILEPFDDAFCDILDVKLSTQNIFTGRRDRVSLAAGLHEVAAQLREYAAYFENQKYQKFVQQKYGLRIYRPRLIALVGRDMRQMTEPQFRRAMTAYDNLQIITFDQLIEHSKRRILI